MVYNFRFNSLLNHIQDGPVVLPLGYSLLSRKFDNLIPKLVDKYHIIAPNCPAYGTAPRRKDRGLGISSIKLPKFSMLSWISSVYDVTHYVMDFRAYVGYRLTVKHSERISALILQNEPAYKKRSENFWAPIVAHWKDGSVEHDE